MGQAHTVEMDEAVQKVDSGVASTEEKETPLGSLGKRPFVLKKSRGSGGGNLATMLIVLGAVAVLGIGMVAFLSTKGTVRKRLLTPVTAHGVHPAKDGVSVSIKDVVRDGSSFYVRFAVTNSSSLPYRIELPNVFEIAPRQSADLLPSMKDEQVAAKTVAQFGANQTTQVPVGDTDIPQKDLSPGQTAQGVVEIKPEDVSKLGIYEFDFGADGGHAVKAAAVL